MPAVCIFKRLHVRDHVHDVEQIYFLLSDAAGAHKPASVPFALSGSDLVGILCGTR